MWCPVTYLIQFFSQLQHFFHFFSSAVISHIYHSHSNPPPLPIFTFFPSYFRIREMCFRSRGDDVGRGRVRSGVSVRRRAMRAATPTSIPSHPLFPKSTQAFGSSVKSASLTVVYSLLYGLGGIQSCVIAVLLRLCAYSIQLSPRALPLLYVYEYFFSSQRQ